MLTPPSNTIVMMSSSNPCAVLARTAPSLAVNRMPANAEISPLKINIVILVLATGTPECLVTESWVMEERLRRTAAKLARSEAKTLDRVFMHDLVLDVEIGVYTHEKGVTQRVRFSVDVDVLSASVALDDDIGRAFDYDTIIKGIKEIIARSHINLVETLAEEVASHRLSHPRASAVKVTIEKLDKEPGAVGVEIVRSKGSA